MLDQVVARGRAAVITGAAGGIGLAAAERLAHAGMDVVLADLGGDALQAAREKIAARAGGRVMAVAVDVASAGDMERLAREARGAFGDVALLMNNAGVGGGGPAKPWEAPERWRRVLDVNVLGVVKASRRSSPT
jgi:NAD(P)-dependent dehydrogenase (short-subunit alcohol dehydrogenase family)